MDDHNHTGHAYPADTASQLSLAHSATWHCLMGCGLGEVLGVIIGTALGFSTVNTIIIAVVLGFVFGFVFGMRPLLRAGFDFSRALHQVLIAESLSIVVMGLRVTINTQTRRHACRCFSGIYIKQAFINVLARNRHITGKTKTVSLSS